MLPGITMRTHGRIGNGGNETPGTADGTECPLIPVALAWTADSGSYADCIQWITPDRRLQQAQATYSPIDDDDKEPGRARTSGDDSSLPPSVMSTAGGGATAPARGPCGGRCAAHIANGRTRHD